MYRGFGELRDYGILTVSGVLKLRGELCIRTCVKKCMTCTHNDGDRNMICVCVDLCVVVCTGRL